MDNDLVGYIERLQLMAFFAGYPLIYTLIYFIAGEQRTAPIAFVKRVVRLLPFGYALTGTLFLGFALNNMFPNYSLKNFIEQATYLKIWGLLALVFWIPLFSKKTVFSLLHSLVFFFFLLKDLFIHITSPIGGEVIRNDMNIYTDSLLLNAGTLAAVLLTHVAFNAIQNRQKAKTSNH